MKVRLLVALLTGGSVIAGAAGTVAAEQAKPAAAAPRLVVVTVTDPVGEKMAYSRPTIAVKPGERVKIRLVAMGQLPRAVMTHNWVLLKAGTDAKKFADAAALSPATGYIPAAMKPQVLAQTDMVGPGEQAEVVFTAPATPGSYPYLCTVPAHFGAGMSGTLIVK